MGYRTIGFDIDVNHLDHTTRQVRQVRSGINIARVRVAAATEVAGTVGCAPAVILGENAARAQFLNSYAVAFDLAIPDRRPRGTAIGKKPDAVVDDLRAVNRGVVGIGEVDSCIPAFPR